VDGNLVAAAMNLDGCESAHNLTLPYRADCLNVIPSGLNPCLLAGHPRPRRLPDSLVRELGVYPDWELAGHPEGSRTPGARLPVALLRTVGATRP
ncbi:MAG: hypothetical protein Q7T90_04525, partial [Thiobacillus sp.]|nr:hypothetical protein [Thiobacillus sp.]